MLADGIVFIFAYCQVVVAILSDPAIEPAKLLKVQGSPSEVLLCAPAKNGGLIECLSLHGSTRAPLHLSAKEDSVSVILGAGEIGGDQIEFVGYKATGRATGRDAFSLAKEGTVTTRLCGGVITTKSEAERKAGKDWLAKLLEPSQGQ